MKLSHKPCHIFSLTSFILILVLGLGGSSCVLQQEAKNQGKTANTNKSPVVNTTPTPTVTKTPVAFNERVNFFQNGSVTTTSTLNLEPNFNDSIYLRGQEIHQYLGTGSGGSNEVCLVAHFSAAGKLLILNAAARYFFNFSSQSKEHYYHLQSTDPSLNKAACQKTGLLNTLTSLYPGVSFVYSFAEVCPNCNTASSSAPIRLFSVAGNEQTNLIVRQLNFLLRAQFDTTIPESASCTESGACKDLGYDCCLERQCVKDKQLRSGVNQSLPEFLQAQQDIAREPTHISNYPNFYYICPVDIIPSPTPIPTINAGVEAKAHLDELRELYDCTTTNNDELSICTISYPNASTQIAAAVPTPFETGPDDRNFRTTYMGSDPNKLTNHSITEIIYADKILFKDNQTLLTGFSIDNVGIANSTNDTLTDKQKITVTRPLEEGDPNDILKIKYKIDGSCIPVNNSLAKCDKYYVQGQDIGAISDHIASNSKFLLPIYADLTRTLNVTVDGYSTVEGNHWRRPTTSADKYIEFIPFNSANETGLEVFDRQVIRITFYVNLTAFPVLQKKKEALARIDQICNCGSLNCGLAPVITTDGTRKFINNYSCVYPTPILPEPPLQQTVILSAKTVPVRYYDSLGVSHDDPNKTITGAQEGKVFSYTAGNTLKPNNALRDNDGKLIDVGFNEIYGSYNFAQNAPLAPKVLTVVAGRQYDIIANSGVFSTCQGCGNDYYSITNKLFPENFRFRGGGYSPDPRKSDRKGTNIVGEGQYRSDDLLFGRACFVPATMIPWTHRPHSDLAIQRKGRLGAQHFLFANGYQRDWYGFDYGSIIGSFDGVSWFSVGNQRRVKAKTNKMFLAMNAYFGDLTQENTYSVTVSEAAPILFSGSTVTFDFDTDGAECQRYHVCEKDQDCIAQLGWDYVCQSINDIKTPWPHFDVNAREVANTQRLFRLIDITSGTSGSTKRCVYRGRGTPCHADYRLSDPEATFTRTDQPGLHACVPNSYCQRFLDSSDREVEKFNRRIGRYAKGPQAQNQSTEIDSSEETDTFGLGARVIGRPYKFHGPEKIDAEVRAQLTGNKITSLCLPGKNPDTASFAVQHDTTPGVFYNGDKILGIGMSIDETQPISTQYLSSCGIFEATGNYYHLNPDNFTKSLNSNDLSHLAGSQAFSTNILKIFEQDPNNPIEILQDSSTTLIDKEILQENRCLRAPGSPCFSNFECGSSSYIKTKISNVDTTFLEAFLNGPEIDYWKEELVCGQFHPTDSPEFNIKNNKCCRETGQKMTIYSDMMNVGSTSSIDTFRLAGIALPHSSSGRSVRYSRIAPAYNDMKTEPATFPPLKVVPSDQCVAAGGCSSVSSPSQVATYQFMTLDTIAKRTCCAGHWVRHFEKDVMGGGHQFGETKRQTVDFSGFRCLAWSPSTSADSFFSCSDPESPDCDARSITNPEAEKYLKLMSSLELLGIPQVLIKSTMDHNGNPLDDTKALGCYIGYADKGTPPAGTPIKGTIKKASNVAGLLGKTLANPFDFANDPGLDPPEYRDTEYRYFSAGNMDNFADNLRKIFSAHEFSCCLPAGVVFPFTIDSDDKCCTGQRVVPGNNRCCLRAYTNVTVYLNRYVSSEANHLAKENFDPLTGSPVSPGLVQQIATDKNLCCSGRVGFGRAVDNLVVEGSAADARDRRRRRFIYRSQDDNISFWEKGQRWNTDVYCLPVQQ